ncbi:MAG: FAD-dependent oxidoreductase [Deltaproteobacteria bacterium]|nr:FAD-dependent oxidoreductase [Deltaproteobacteria bacterium]
MREENLDVAVVGGGTAGLFALAQAARRAEKVALFEGGHEGTMCARAGCMPSKALIHAARCAREVRTPCVSGLPVGSPDSIDYAKVMAEVREKRDVLVSRTVVRTRQAFGEAIIRENARFVAPMVLEAGETRYRCGGIVLSVGSLPVVPPGWRLVPEKVVTTEEFFNLPTLPRDILVVGMGPVGIELSMALAGLGLSVTCAEMGKTAAGISDPEILSSFVHVLQDTPNFRYHFRTKASLLDVGERVGVQLEDLEGGAQWNAGFDLVLLAVGRAPDFAGLDLPNAGIKLSQKGWPVVDEKTLACVGQKVFVAGDASGIRPFFHDAADQGRLAGRNAAKKGEPESLEEKTPLTIIFTEPNVAFVGLDWRDFDEAAHVAGEIDVRNSGRGLLENLNHGKVRLYVERAGQRLVGAALCAPSGEHLAHFLAQAVSSRLTVRDMLNLPFYHPTYEELVPQALLDAKKKLNPDYS